MVPAFVTARRCAPALPRRVPATRSHTMRGRSSANSSDGYRPLSMSSTDSNERGPRSLYGYARRTAAPSSSTRHSSIAHIATTCWARTSRGLRGTVVDSMRPSSIPSTTAAVSTRSPRNFGMKTPRVDEHDRGAMVADELEEARVDRRPDAVRRLAGIVVGLQLRHVLDRDLDLDLHRLQAAGVDDGHVAAGPAEEFRHLFQRALGGGQSDSLRFDFRQRGQSLEAQRQMRATLGGGDRVDLVHDEPPHRS